MGTRDLRGSDCRDMGDLEDSFGLCIALVCSPGAGATASPGFVRGLIAGTWEI